MVKQWYHLNVNMSLSDMYKYPKKTNSKDIYLHVKKKLYIKKREAHTLTIKSTTITIFQPFSSKRTMFTFSDL